jgi:hypothetical protein
LIYPGAGHLVGTFPYRAEGTQAELSGRRILPLGGSRAGDAAAQEQGWPKLLAFLASLQAG